MRLEDKVCIITGAASGIGRATAVAAAANKLMTVGLDIDEYGGKEIENTKMEFFEDAINLEVEKNNNYNNQNISLEKFICFYGYAIYK